MKLWFRLGGFAVLVVLVVLIVRVDPGALARRLAALDLRWVGVALALHIPMIFAKAWRWQGLTRAAARAGSPIGRGYGPGRALVVFLVGLYAGTVTPGRLGEFLRAGYLARDRAATPGAALASVLGDRLFDLYVLLALGAGGVAWFGLSGRVTAAGVAVVAAAALAPLPLASPRFVEAVVARAARLGHPGSRLRRWLKAVRLGRAVDVLDQSAAAHGRDFAAGLRAQLAPAVAARSLGLTVAGYALYFTQCWYLFQAVGAPLRPADAVFTMALVNLVSLAPITFAAIGTRDAALVLLLSLRGYGSDVALAASAAILVLFYGVTAALGFVAWLWAPLPPPAVDAPAAALTSGA